ncbi:putative dihydrodipicolinate synthetase [Gordonia polyisoprenivorans VH2]|uniref:Probable 5-dehydro-4-deoxyglucarate dehydratase n=2 Tax=Gordonia polyisoprenivorans TaxID=84595 RepID=H6MZF0_GORPV|nr:5-dehydro-4-deoxyglucarate dehydratase [Gordonia polyisoprenivorans]AFA75692.1 putative dihydrodipicolinate synthetase [Gordonia polyisoprenivorans VH2]MBE7194738.1 5-dehydro-4-deoxyglucarate dehydratase [Gordonia polyisoprenivorans]NKY02858.1 5-dehydro-4-deoxyglucarate dehydratase [Gordonia polyisoprenivorans]UZF56141.1 5-dehydro-4-deoxyglucarate dehydratase [Gordonia polyisoprenivorans]WCB37202.1 5-dehydro-4-deoxyglucarate dehydratase [Gordonia polyisoprenivorans]
MLDGVLFFPVTPFDADGEVDYDRLAEHVERGVAAGPGGVFIACGTGEFHALGLAEFTRIVRCAVDVVAGRVPVFAGTGGSLVQAKEFAAAAADQGADGLLLLPPYLVTMPPAGLVAYTTQVAAQTNLPVIVYNRANAVFDEQAAVEVAALPTVIGLKDGTGDLDTMARIVGAVTDSLVGSGKEFLFFNGLPTAEITQQAYRAIGVTLYSSATFAFAPELALAFYHSLESGDTALTDDLLRTFFHPLVRLRNRVPGYAVSLVKAGVTLEGIPAGSVRAPLVDPSPAHLDELAAITAAGRAALAGAMAAEVGA